VIDGIQFQLTGATGYKYINALYTNNGGTIKNCITKFIETADVYWLNFQSVEIHQGNLYAYNNLIYQDSALSGHGTLMVGFYSGYFNTGRLYAYNNTIVGNANLYAAIGFYVYGGSIDMKVVNNICQTMTDGYDSSLAWVAGSDYNISNVASDAPGANSKNSTTVSFTDAANNDFHLSSTDTTAIDHGVDLSQDPNLPFTTDIDGQTRPYPTGGKWDIGADEVYYNVATIQSSSLEKEAMTANLVGYWSFDGGDITGVGVGSTAVDRSGNNNNGLINGATPTEGARGQALSFNGTSSTVSIGNTNQSIG